MIIELDQKQLQKEQLKRNQHKEARRLFASLKRSYDGLILDIEATGFSSSTTAEIIEIAIINAKRQVQYRSLIKPIHPISEESTQIHGITNKMVENAPTWKQVHKEIYQILRYRHRRILSFGSFSEIRYLRQTSRMWGIKIPFIEMICLCRAYQHLLKSNQSISLENAVGYPIKHRALADCFATWDLIKKIKL
jgi:DNA polymerase III subunit epsilon